MKIDAYIEKLLYNHNCVVIPGFGAFLAHENPAEIYNTTHTFLPPSKNISFNAQLYKNDGLLITEIARDKKLTYETLLYEVKKIAETWKKTLENGESITITGVGKLCYNKAQKIQFQPENKTNYLTSSFGLSSFIATPIQQKNQENKIPLPLTPEKQKSYSIPWLKYAAILLMMISLGAISYQKYNNIQLKQLVVQQNAQKQVSHIIQQATFFDSNPLELPTLNIEIEKKQIAKHYVIAGAFRIEKNAEKKIQQLKNKRYNALYLGVNPYGLHQVAYDSFENLAEALIFLRKIQATESPDAWLWSEK